MTLGSTHDPPSSFFVFAGSFRLQSLKYLSVSLIAQKCSQVGRWAEAKFNGKAFEQSGANITIGLIVVQSVGIDFLDRFIQRAVQSGLQVV